MKSTLRDLNALGTGAPKASRSCSEAHLENQLQLRPRQRGPELPAERVELVPPFFGQFQRLVQIHCELLELLELRHTVDQALCAFSAWAAQEGRGGTRSPRVWCDQVLYRNILCIYIYYDVPVLLSEGRPPYGW